MCKNMTTLYERCITEITKPELIEYFKVDLNLLPAHAKNDILSVLCKSGFIKDGSILKHLVNTTLVAIDFSECVVNDDMLFCLHNCTYLRKLDLRLVGDQDRCFTKNGLIKLFPHITFLEVLDIPNYKDFTDDVTKKLCDCCIYLRQLYIQYSSITNLSLFLIGEQLHYMTILNIRGTRVDDRGIEFLVRGPLVETLTEVNTTRCTKITPVAQVTLSQKCKNIKMVYPKPRPVTGLRFQFKAVFPRQGNPGYVRRIF